MLHFEFILQLMRLEEKFIAYICFLFQINMPNAKEKDKGALIAGGCGYNIHAQSNE